MHYTSLYSGGCPDEAAACPFEAVRKQLQM